MHKLQKTRILTDALSECCEGNAVGLLSYIDDAWKWEYDEDDMTLSVNLGFLPESLSEAQDHHYTGFEFVDGWREGIFECRLAVFKLSSPFPLIEAF